MTNYEKYKNEIEKIILAGEIIAVDKEKNHVCACNSILCSMCAFNVLAKTCVETRKKWLNAEYQEPEIDWSKVPKGTRVWVRDREGQNWLPTIFLEVVNANYRFKTTGQDAWVFKNRGSLDSSSWKHCKLDDSVDPTPYLKKVGE